MKSSEIEFKNDSIRIEVDKNPKMVLIGSEKAKLIDLPYHGEVVVKVVHGRIQKFEVVEGELF